MAEELVFKAVAEDDERNPRLILTARDQTIRRGEKDYEYFSVMRHHPRQEWFVEVQYSVDETFRPGTKWARPTRGSYGGAECFSKDIPTLIDCIEQKFGVKVRIEGATMNQINRVAQRIHEDDVAPEPKEIGLFDVMESNSEQVLEGMGKDITSFCTRAGVGKNVSDKGFAESTCKDILEGIVSDLDLEIPNEDWNSDLKYGNNTFQRGQVSEAVGRMVVKRKLKEIIDRDLESAEYRCEELWGVAPRQPYSMAKKEKAQQIAEKLFEPFERMKREELNSVGDETARKLESDLCKNAARLFFQVYLQSMKKRVEHLR